MTEKVDKNIGMAETKEVHHVESNPYLDQILAMSPEERRVAEKKLVRKMDIYLVPWMTLLYLMSFLDRVNIGAAKLYGLMEDLDLDSKKYTIASMIFFVSYVAFEVPFNLVLKKFPPSISVPTTMVFWAICQICMGVVTNYSQLLAVRFLLGAFEAGLFPGLNFYLTGWYRREELSKRVAFFFAGAVLSGAFGGIFGYAIGLMQGVGGKPGWAWIFIIEGILTLVIALGSFRMIHDWPDKARFLTDFERELVLHRLKADSGLATGGEWSSKAAWSAMKDWKTYLFMLCYIGTAVCVYSQSLFAPTIVAALGKWTPAQSLLLSVPPYVLAFITTLVTAYFSDKYRQRGIFNMFWATLAVAGYAILIGTQVKQTGVQLFAVFLTTMSICPLIAITITWAGNNFGNHYKKAVAMGLVFSAGNAGGIVSSFSYRPQDAPPKGHYVPGHATAMSFAAMNLITSVILYLGMRKANRDREAKYGPPPNEHDTHEYEDPEYKAKWGLEGLSDKEIMDLGDSHPAFRYIL